jgi:LysM repeat protein
MNFPAVFRPARLGSGLALLAFLAACSEPLDYDLRGNIGGFSTARAAQAPMAARPKPDDRGIISYPTYQVAVARRGDSVADVAARIGLPAGELARFNGLDTNVTMRTGEVLALPRRVAEPAPAAGTAGGVDIQALAGGAIDTAPDTTPLTTATLAPAPTPKPAAKPKPKPAPKPEPVRHKVVRGETAYTISRLYQVPVKSLAEWNGLGSDFAIREGQYLLVPLAGGKPAKPGAAAATTRPGAGSPTPTPPSATRPLPDEKIDPSPAKPAPESIGEPSQAPVTAMAFPVQGKIVRAYSKGRNEGIDISAPAGTPVKAAADGTVAAVTSDADQVSIVVIRHAGNLLTVYANVDQITVKKGDIVERGQRLASLREGENPYVRFEVRDGFDSVDPIPYLE